MPKGSGTTLFVSSTCYDLAQLRANLRDFAEEVGFEPVLSELDSFPVNPSQSAIQNCLDAVRTRADIFVLVVGGRYGSMNEAGKSITNLEYLEASACGIPVIATRTGSIDEVVVDEKFCIGQIQAELLFS